MDIFKKFLVVLKFILKVFIYCSPELFSDFHPAEVEKELQRREDGKVEIDNFLPFLLFSTLHNQQLSANKGNRKITISCNCDYLSVDQGQIHPIVHGQHRGATSKTAKYCSLFC